MKILHVLTQLPSLTGSGVYFTNLIDSLNKMGHENAAVFGTEEGHKIDVKASPTYPVVYNTEEIPFHICGMSDEMPYNSTIYGEMTEEEIGILLDSFRKRLELAKEEFAPDLVISHHLFFVTDLVREVFSDTKVVGISHGTDIRQVKKHHKFLDRLTHIKDLNHVLTVTSAEDESIRDLLKVSPEKIHNVGGGYNDQVFYPAEKPGDKNTIDIVYAGKITASKGVFELCKTLPLLEEKYPNVKLYIIGNPDYESCMKLKESASHSPNLIICDALDQKRLGNMLRHTDIFVLPSYFEALGLIAIEALACHRLVVTSDIIGLKKLLSEDIKNSGVIEFTDLPRIYDVDKAVEDDIPAYVERLAANISKQIERLDENLFDEHISKEIEKLSWSNIGYKIMDIILV